MSPTSPPDDAGAASGVVNVTHQLGGSPGLGGLVTLFAAAGSGALDGRDLLAHRISASLTAGAALLVLALAATLIVGPGAAVAIRRRRARRGSTSCVALIAPHPTRRNDMQITRNSVETATRPSDWFTALSTSTPPAPVGGLTPVGEQHPLHPRARTAWHSHRNGQTIYVTEGVGRCQRRGGPVEVIPPVTASSSSPAKTTVTALPPTAS